jgi:hypothetical protein
VDSFVSANSIASIVATLEQVKKLLHAQSVHLRKREHDMRRHKERLRVCDREGESIIGLYRIFTVREDLVDEELVNRVEVPAIEIDELTRAQWLWNHLVQLEYTFMFVFVVYHCHKTFQQPSRNLK